MEPAALNDFTTTASLHGMHGHVAGAARVLDPADMQHVNHPSVMPRVRAVTSHAAAYTQRWWCGTIFSGQHIFVPGGGSHALTDREPARMSARLLIAAGCGSARVPTCENALRHVRISFYHLIGAKNADWFLADALRDDGSTSGKTTTMPQRARCARR
jgi:hypothetical protein